MGERKHVNIDGGYAWVILFVGWVVQALLGTVYYSTSVVNVAVLETMDEGVVKTSWVGSVFLGTIMLSGPITGCVTNLLGCRLTTIIGGVCMFTGFVGAHFSTSVNALIISYGVTSGLGMGLATTASSVSVGYYFERLRPMAAGILVSGAGFGMLAGAPLVRFMFDSYGLSGMFLLLGAISSNNCVAGMLMRTSMYETTQGQDKKGEPESNTFLTVLKNFPLVLKERSFLLYASSYGLWCCGSAAYNVHLMNYVELKGTSSQLSPMLFTAMGVTSIFARILTGFAGSDPIIGPILLHTGTVGLCGVVIVLVPVLSGTFSTQLVFSALYGLYTGGPMALNNPICVELLGVRRLASGYGMISMFCGVGLLTGPPFSGFVYGATGNFDLSYILAGCIVVLGSLVSLPIIACKSGEGGPSINTGLDTEMNVQGPEEGEQSYPNSPLMSDDVQQDSIIPLMSEDVQQDSDQNTAHV